MIYTKEQLEGMSDYELNMILADIANKDNFDCCNSAVDAFVLCSEENITLINLSSVGCCGWLATKVCAGFEPRFLARHEKPMLAVSIVYILIKQEEQNENN